MVELRHAHALQWGHSSICSRMHDRIVFPCKKRGRLSSTPNNAAVARAVGVTDVLLFHEYYT